MTRQDTSGSHFVSVCFACAVVRSTGHTLTRFGLRSGLLLLLQNDCACRRRFCHCRCRCYCRQVIVPVVVFRNHRRFHPLRQEGGADSLAEGAATTHGGPSRCAPLADQSQARWHDADTQTVHLPFVCYVSVCAQTPPVL